MYMVNQKLFETFYGSYKNHPRVVQSGFDELPILEKGRFYIVYYQNDASYQGFRSACPPTLIYVSDKPVFHGKHKISYQTLSFSVQESGCMGYGFIYMWFWKGGNCIVEIPEEQQKIYKDLMKSLSNHSDYENY